MEVASAPPPLAGLRWLRRGLILLPVILTVAFSVVDWRRVDAQAARTAAANVALVREYALRLVQSQDVLLRSAEGAVAELQDVPGRDARAHNFLASLDEGIEEVVRLALVAPNGDFVLNSTQFPARGNVGHREYITAALAGATPFIDRLVVQPEDRDVLIVSRPSFNAPQAGVWNVALDVKVVQSFLRNVSPDTRDAASLLRADGKVLVRHVSMPEPVTLGPDHPVMRGIAQSDEGTYAAKAVSDGIRRFYAYERVGDLPLFAVAGVAQSGVVWTWLWQTALFGSLLGTLAVATMQYTRISDLVRAAEFDRLRSALDKDLLAESEKTAAYRAMMLKELNHRIKNSLSMINALIMLQARRPDGPDLGEVSKRVVAFAHIHDMLHRSADDLTIDLGTLVREICASDAVVAPERGIAIEYEGRSITVEASVASPLALSLIELVTNAQKHAYGERGGVIRVTLEKTGAEARLGVEDRGRGLPEGGNRRSGLRIVEALARQIGGRLEVESGAGGARMTIVFPLAEREESLDDTRRDRVRAAAR